MTDGSPITDSVDQSLSVSRATRPAAHVTLQVEMTVFTVSNCFALASLVLSETRGSQPSQLVNKTFYLSLTFRVLPGLMVNTTHKILRLLLTRAVPQ